MKTKFYSEKLDKLFDTEKECVAAENAYDEKHAAELKAKEERKVAAQRVEDAEKAVNDAEFAYLKKKQELIEEYQNKINEALKPVKEARKAKDAALEDFCAKYGSYHKTIDGRTVEIYKSKDTYYENIIENLISAMF